ncbi:VWA domain-containing protein [bacterium]|nr:VWA domain-containing protein [bacterium]MBU1991295.1 VWA domain-containing protein [bacterium]
MSFLNPEYFWLLLVLIPFFMKTDLADVSFKAWGYAFTFVCIVIALGRPVIEQEPIKSEQVLSDVIIAVDLSYSMQATDVEPNRLVRAKEILRDLVKKEQKSRFGVLGFTSNAIVLSPLTQDSELLLHLFSSLDDTLVITKGSSVMPALELARRMSKAKNPSLVLLSDGGDEPSYEKEAAYAKENGLIVNIFMLGTKFGGTLRLDNGELLKDESDDIVVSRENEAIRHVAETTGGVYTKDFDEILSALESQREEEYRSKSIVIKNLELFYYCIALAILSFLITLTTLKRYVQRFFVSLMLLFGVHTNAGILDAYYAKSAEDYYIREEYKKSAEYYSKIPQSRAYFNTACGYYKNGEYEKALLYFQRVKSHDAKFKSEVFYNIANSLVRLKEFEKAREAYLKSLTLFFTKEADENLRYIKNAGEEMSMLSGQQKTKNNSSIAKEESSMQKKKEGGGSNMKVSADAGSGAGENAKKTQSEGLLNLNKGKAKLSSKQYELINKRGVNEKRPW